MESLNISSGKLLVIDQFMLGNTQFWKPIFDGQADISSQVTKYGGVIEELAAGEYQVLRDPVLKMMLVASQVQDPESLFQASLEKIENLEVEKTVLVETKCLVFIDCNVLSNRELIEQYSELRKMGDDKPARDLLRSKGAAVRYGFNSHGDELAVSMVDGVLAFWPDVLE